MVPVVFELNRCRTGPIVKLVDFYRAVPVVPIVPVVLAVLAVVAVPAL